jgi:predicted ATPase/DNA-binding CsgD family transcriptional regulator
MRTEQNGVGGQMMNTLRVMLDALTEREQEILHLLDEGYSDQEIAYKLSLAVGTVKWHNRQIYGKLDVNGRTHAIARARQLGLLGIGSSDSREILPSHNLPAQTTRLVGRKHELAEVKRLLQAVRLLTLTGAPGTGKTRLAYHIAADIADEFTHGVYYVSLAPLTDAQLTASTIAAVLGVKEIATETLDATLKHHVADKQLLLVLDNFEHLLKSAVLVSELLATAPHLKVIVTSRERLNLYGEQEYFVPPLPLPNISDQALLTDVAQCDAVTLFVQRAQSVQSAFELTDENALEVAKICVQLDGLPLAIELAAARIKLLTPRLLLERLTSRLKTLTGGSRDLPVRQQTLRSTIYWSYHLLEPIEKTLFMRLAVFAGGWSLDAAEKVCGETISVPVLDVLTSLVDKSLAQQSHNLSDEPRFSMLETLREFALEQLEISGDAEIMRALHANYFINFAEQAGVGLYSMYRSGWLTRLEIEQNNFRAILAWSLAGNPEPGLRLIAALGVCWRVRSYLIEGLNWSRRLLERAEKVAPALRARALSSACCLLACYLGNTADAYRMSSEALDLAYISGDKQTIAKALYARATALIGIYPEEAAPVLDEALNLFREFDDHWELARTFNLKGELARIKDDYATAEQLYRQALTFYRELGNPWGVNIVLQNLGYVVQYRGDLEGAKVLFAESLNSSHELDDRFSIAGGLGGLAGIIGLQGEPERAIKLFGAAEALRATIGADIAEGDRLDYERSVAAARTLVDVETFERLWNQGRAMPLDQVINDALGDG